MCQSPVITGDEIVILDMDKISMVTEEEAKASDVVKEKSNHDTEDEKNNMLEVSCMDGTLIDREYSRKSCEKLKMDISEDFDVQKNNEITLAKKLNFYCCSEGIPKEAKDLKTHVEERHIREWNSELRENHIFMDEQNFERKKSKLEEDFEIQEVEQCRREIAVMQEQKNV